jgi:hypothetical protein
MFGAHCPVNPLDQLAESKVIYEFGEMGGVRDGGFLANGEWQAPRVRLKANGLACTLQKSKVAYFPNLHYDSIYWYPKVGNLDIASRTNSLITQAIKI